MTTVTTRRRSLKALDRHGAALHSIASLLTPDPDLAESLVVHAVTASAPGPPGDLRQLSALLVRGWFDGHLEEIESIPSVKRTLPDRAHGLPPHQRASLALCRFGDHTYRQAADVLGVPHATVAELLGATLRALQPGRPAPDTPTVTERPAV